MKGLINSLGPIKADTIAERLEIEKIHRPDWRLGFPGRI